MINIEMLATWLTTIVAGAWFIITEVKIMPNTLIAFLLGVVCGFTLGLLAVLIIEDGDIE